ncbi:MAG TPA: ATP-binding protein, partial [Acholeplasma sp.]|nr:ATP-binding protein [Acholeplasma sp.]
MNTNPHAIFGANGSGKTIILRVFQTLQEIMTTPVNNLGLFIPNLETGVNKDSKVRIVFEYKGFVFDYKIITNLFNGDKIKKEMLSVNNLELVRENIKIILKSKNNEETLTATNSKYSALRQIGIEKHEESSPKNLVSIAYDYLSSINYIDVRGDVFGSVSQISILNKLLVEKSKDVNKLLKKYNNFPVYELTLRETKVDEKQSLNFKREGSNIFMPEILMSNGMRNHSIILTIILQMKKGTLLVVDELERSLHPFVASQFIEELNNNFDIQLIFSSHNTNLLKSLRPDQIFFSKWDEKKNQSNYNKLSDTYPNIREINNIEKMYYGGLLDE